MAILYRILRLRLNLSISLFGNEKVFFCVFEGRMGKECRFCAALCHRYFKFFGASRLRSYSVKIFQ